MSRLRDLSLVGVVARGVVGALLKFLDVLLFPLALDTEAARSMFGLDWRLLLIR